MSDGGFAVRPLKFWNEYETLPDGSTKVIEKMEWTRPGMAHIATGVVRITEKAKNAPGWETVKEAYERWKDGQEMPESGTPLGAWPGVTSEQVQAFKMAGIKSVEDVAIMNDRMKAMVRLPGLESLKQEAKMFLEAKDRRGVEIQLKEQAEQIAALKAMLEDKADSDAVAPKRRGRPPKAQNDGHILDVREPIDLDEEAA